MHTGFDVQFLNAYGEQGWELVQIVPASDVHSTAAIAFAIFKRPDPEFVSELQDAAQGYSFVQQP